MALGGLKLESKKIGFEIEQRKHTEIKVNIQNSNWELYHTVSVINEGICELQGLFPQYLVITIEKHKKLHRFYKNYKKNQNQTNLINLKNAYDDLLLYLNNEIIEACKIVLSFLSRYYKYRSEIQPRICIRIPTGPEGNEIVDLYPPRYSSKPRINIKENTAFFHFKNTGKFFICNNIPEAIKREEYKNSRINLKAVKENYKPPLRIKKWWYRFRSKPLIDEKWRSYWIDAEDPNLSIHDFYKSVLVVPMTLLNARLNHEFISILFGLEDISEFTEKYKKLAFGFICIDHIYCDFFDEEKDVRCGYIFADFLSLFFIVRKLFIERSLTFKRAKEIIQKGGL